MRNSDGWNPRWYIAALLSGLVPGLGIYYAGLDITGLLIFIGWLTVRVVTVHLLILAGTDLLNPLYYMYLVPVYWLAVILLSIRIVQKRRSGKYRGISRSLRYYLLLTLAALSVSIAGDLVMRRTVIGAYSTSSESMEPTLVKGDFVLANKLSFRSAIPERNDLIVFNATFENNSQYTKRVLGLPGDTVEIRDGKLWIDGSRHYCSRVRFREYDKYRKILDYGPEKIPNGHVFVIGDNLIRSYDSRFWGPLEIEEIIGKLRIIYFSIDLETKKVRWDRIGKIVE